MDSAFTVLNEEGKMCHLNVRGRRSRHSIDNFELYWKPLDTEGMSSASQDSVEGPVGVPSPSNVPRDGMDSVAPLYQGSKSSLDGEVSQIDSKNPLNGADAVN